MKRLSIGEEYGNGHIVLSVEEIEEHTDE